MAPPQPQPGGKAWRRRHHRSQTGQQNPVTPVYQVTAQTYAGGAVALTTSTAPGDGIAIWYDGNGTTISATDTQGNTYVQIGTMVNGNALLVATYKGSWVRLPLP